MALTARSVSFSSRRAWRKRARRRYVAGGSPTRSRNSTVNCETPRFTRRANSSMLIGSASRCSISLSARSMRSSTGVARGGSGRKAHSRLVTTSMSAASAFNVPSEVFSAQFHTSRSKWSRRGSTSVTRCWAQRQSVVEQELARLALAQFGYVSTLGSQVEMHGNMLELSRAHLEAVRNVRRDQKQVARREGSLARLNRQLALTAQHKNQFVVENYSGGYH